MVRLTSTEFKFDPAVCACARAPARARLLRVRPCICQPDMLFLPAHAPMRLPVRP